MPRVVTRVWAVVAAAVLVVGGCTGKDDPTRPQIAASIEYAPGLLLDLYRPIRGFAPLPTIVLVHGGGFNEGARENMANLAEALAYHGYLTATIDYHLAGGNWFPATDLSDPGLAAAATLATQDVAAAVDWVVANAATYRADPNRVAVAGYSAGGIAALELAAHPPPGVWAAVAIAGAAIDPAALAAPHAPLLLVHGDLDDVIPPALADATCAAAVAGGGCEVHHVDEVGHDLLTSVKFQDVVGTVDAFLKSVTPD